MALVRVSRSVAKRLASRGRGLSLSDTQALLDVKDSPSKYHAQQTTLDGVRFDSRGESVRYAWLKLQARIGEIRNLTRQTEFTLHVCNLATGELTAIGNYRCDFDYIVAATGLRVVEDWKGMETLPLAKWKIKHLFAEYGIVVREERAKRLTRSRPRHGAR